MNIRKHPDGTRVASVIPADRIRRWRGFEGRERDVLVATYPKAGSSWLLTLVTELLGQAPSPSIPLDQAVCWWERDCISELESPLEDNAVRVFKTHLPGRYWSKFRGRIIVLIRDPRDTAVSYFHHALSKRCLGFRGTWNEFFNRFVNGEVEGGAWGHHVAESLRFAQRSRTLVASFEDFLCDAADFIDRVATFLQVGYDQEGRSSARARTDFGWMASKSWINVPWCPLTRDGSPHLRRGDAGQWHELMSASQESELALAIATAWATSPSQLRVALNKRLR